MGDHLLPSCNPLIQHQPNLQSFQPDLSSHDDFLEQMLSSLPNLSWPPHLSNPNPNPFLHSLKPPLERLSDVDALPRFPSLHHDDVDSKLRNSSPMAAAAKSFLLHQQLLLSRAHTPGADAELTRFPLSLVGGAQGAAEGSVQALHNGFPTQQPFQAGAMAGVNQSPASGSTGGGGEAAPRRPRVRARRGQATDPHSIAERLRRERIAERMKALQELVPNANKTDKSSMLDEIIDYVKFLQLQVKVLSMSRLGGAAAHPTEGPVAGCSSSEGMSVTEQQVIKLMEEDMGSAMQYLQGKGLCLMPISLATAISTISNRQPPRPHNPMLPFTANANNNHGVQAQPSSLVNGDGFLKKFNPAPQAF